MKALRSASSKLNWLGGKDQHTWRKTGTKTLRRSFVSLNKVKTVGVGSNWEQLYLLSAQTNNIFQYRGYNKSFSSSSGSRNFRLDDDFLKTYEDKKPPFGFNGLGELVYYRTYSRYDPKTGKRELWKDTVARVVNGCFSMQKRWMIDNVLGWEEEVAQQTAQEMFQRIFDMKFLPPGRGLWAMGTALTEERDLFAALNNCAFVSTNDIGDIDKLRRQGLSPSSPFTFTMDASMLGVGVGFDTLGAGAVTVIKPTGETRKKDIYTIPDSREGWVKSLELLLNSYLLHNTEKKNHMVQFNYDKIRKQGMPIRGFGGTASGPEPLIALHDAIRDCLNKIDGKPITVTAIVDIMNMIGKCVIAGNVRRTAEIAFGSPDSDEYISLKDYSKNPERMDFGWTSNNSVFAELGMDYSKVVELVKQNGEPGFAWLDNMRRYGRMCDPPNNKDKRAMGGNPCLEQTLESYELCCLVETFPDRHADLEDYKKTLELAFLYAKTVTLGRTHWPQSNRVMQRNRRIGCSMSGISQFLANRGLHELRIWADEGYKHIQDCDAKFSDLLAIPTSIKTTSIKPSGTVSLLAGATPGVHAPESRYYIRRVRLAANSELITPLRNSGYHIEPAETDPEKTMVVSFPIDVGDGVRVQKNISMWEQLSIAAFLQRYWADNQVSCTVTFDPEEVSTEGMKAALDVFQYQLKGISFLPRIEAGAYSQMPYEEIDASMFHQMTESIKPLDLTEIYEISYLERKDGFEVLEDNENEKVVEEEAEDDDYSKGMHNIIDNRPMPDSFCDNDSCSFDQDDFKASGPVSSKIKISL